MLRNVPLFILFILTIYIVKVLIQIILKSGIFRYTDIIIFDELYFNIYGCLKINEQYVQDFQNISNIYIYSKKIE